jgi:tRNA threonylcarbamoyladenosine biosynthesis protein TsaB
VTPGKPWLAIDTATDLASVAVGVPPAVLGTASVRGARRHGTEIVRLIDEVLSAAHLRPKDLAGIVLGDGPGSFTGLRIGWAAAKGLSQEAGLELRAVPSLMAAAALAAGDLGPVPVAACYDALRGEVYGAVYVVFPGRVETLVAPAIVTIEALAARAPVRPRLAVGDGAVRYAGAVHAWLGVAPVAVEELPGGVLAGALLSLVARDGAVRRLENGLTAEPVYGRLAEAQVKWEARHGRPLSDSRGPDR